VTNNFAEMEVKRFPPRATLQVLQSFPEFMHKVFYPAVRKGWLIVGFNLPFDLSRCALSWHPTRRKRGFALTMTAQLEHRTQTWIPHPYRPEILIEAKDARTAFITRGAPRFRKDEWPNPFRPLDISTLLFSLFDKHMSLGAWCGEFRKKGYSVDLKLDHEPCGRVTREELRYCRQDVKISQQLLNAAMQEFNRHPLPSLLPDKAYSPASVAKAYMHEMGIMPPSQKFNVPKEIYGHAMQGYFGGRAECHIRRVPVPVMRVDFVSQYCTVNTLLGNFGVMTAASVSFSEGPEVTEEVHKLLSTIASTPDKCFEREMWLDFRFFALVKPDRDIFPVRTAYNPRDPDKLNIGLNYLSSEKPIWFAGPGIIASILLNEGKIPHILKVIRVVPSAEKQKDLKPVNLLGKVPIDPNVDDFYKHVVEQKEAHKSDESMRNGLKCVGNAGAYGPLVELNEQPIIQSYTDKKTKQRVYTHPKLDVYSGEHYHQQDATSEIETGGKFYFPPLGALITSGGRLLLAMAQKLVEDAGGKILFCDTDSLCIVANEKGGHVNVSGNRPEDYDISSKEFTPIPCLLRDKVVTISKQFESLNPYSFGGTILKVEDVNHEPSEKKPKGDPSKPFRELYGYAISAKRYCLFEGSHARKIVDAKAHGIGYLFSPIKREKDKDEDRFALEFWQQVLQEEGVSYKNINSDWLDYPAIMKIPVTSPAVLGRLKNFCKPYDFVLSPVVRDGALDPDEQADKPILITRFTKNSGEWLNATYYNVRTGEPCRITTGESKSKNVIPVRSYRDVCHAYVNNPESKFNGPDGFRCGFGTRGMLQRKHVIAGRHIPCGKEFKRRLEQGPVDHEIDSKCRVYENGKVSADAETLRKIGNFSEREIREETGIRRDTIRYFRHGGAVTRKMYDRFSEFLKER
jgi:hypothetical protein